MSRLNPLQQLWQRILGGSLKPQTVVKPVTDLATEQVQPTLYSVQEIALRKRRALVLPPAQASENEKDQSSIARLQIEAMNLGFVFRPEAVEALALQPELMPQIFHILQRLVGADKTWQPMYPNFPEQVHSTSEEALYLNAILHYFSAGEWRPQFPKKSRLPRFEQPELKPLGLINQNDLMKLLTELLSARSALANLDRDILYSFVQHFSEVELLPHIPEEIPFKETLCFWVGETLKQDKTQLAARGLQTATDVLRVATQLSGGDISLAENARFRLTRAQRRWLVSTLEPLINAADLARHPEKWKRLFHCIHIGEYKTAPRSQELARLLRAGQLTTDSAKLEALFETENYPELLAFLKTRPGEFARRLDHLLRLFSQAQGENTLKAFETVLESVSTRVILQMMGHFRTRLDATLALKKKGPGQEGIDEVLVWPRVVMPKGQMAKVKVLKTPLPLIPESLLLRLLELLQQSLLQRFSSLPVLGKVWLDPQLKKCPVPLQMRSASEGLFLIQRGTRLPMDKGRILRFFVHWIGQDIDLSACFLKADLSYHSEVAYYALKSGPQVTSVHSGDITYAPPPDGACEFIDVDLESITDPELRYIAMDVRVYSGGPFSAQQANMGWMLREGLGQRGEIFDAQTVAQRIAIGTASRAVLVAFFDIKNREVIWLDVLGQSRSIWGGNNLASNRFHIRDLLEAALNFKQLSLYDLLALHVKARGEQVDKPEQAEQRFDLTLAYDYTRILAEFMP